LVLGTAYPGSSHTTPCHATRIYEQVAINPVFNREPVQVPYNQLPQTQLPQT
jgi:hypothetical protein